MDGAHSAAGLAIVSAALTPPMFAVFLPGLHELPGLTNAELRGFRRGELYGSILAVGLGLGSSLISRSPWPLLAAVCMTAGLVHIYESAMPKGATA
jgi:hypothetical protein